MNRKGWLGVTAASLPAVGLLLLVALRTSFSQAAPPRRRPVRRPRRALRPRPPRRRPGPVVRRRVVLRRRHPLVVRRVGGKMVIEQAGKVVRTLPAPVVVKTVGALKPVPTVEVAEAPAYQVARVTDEQTAVLVIDGKETTVRLLGVDPALPAGAGADERERTRRFVHNLLAGEWVYLDYDANLEGKDEDGNPVAYLHRAPDGLMVNLELIRQGYALAAEGYDYEHQELFSFYEGKARADHKGMWSSAAATGEGTTEP